MNSARAFRYFAVGGISERLRNPERRPDGKGGLVDVPLAVVTPGVISGNTAGGGTDTYDVDRAYLEELVRNFQRKPGPVPVYWSHDRTPRRSKNGEMPLPASGRVVKVWLEGDELWGRLDLGPRAWNAVVEERGFYGYSIEASYQLTTATGEIEGWTLTGGIFTNNPALDVEFGTDPGDVPRGDETIALRDGGRTEDRTMPPTVTLESLQADVTRLAAESKQKDERVTALTTENAELKKKLETAPPSDKVAALETRMGALEDSNKKLAFENDQLKKTGLARDVVEIVEKAIAAGAPPAFFGGLDVVKKDAVAFLETRFGGKVEALKASVDALPKQTFGRRDVQTGTPEGGTSTDPKEELRLEAVKLAKTKNISFGDALDEIRDTKPELWAKGTAEYGRRDSAAAGE